MVFRRSTNVGFLEAPSLDIRVLHKQKLIVEGEIEFAFREDGKLWLMADVTGRDRPHILVRSQHIYLQARETDTGARRWFFIDEGGYPVEILYLDDGLYRSRRFVNRSYRTQSMSPRWRKIRKAYKREMDDLRLPTVRTLPPIASARPATLLPFDRQQSVEVIKFWRHVCQEQPVSVPIQRPVAWVEEQVLGQLSPRLRMVDLVEGSYLKRGQARGGIIGDGNEPAGSLAGALCIADLRGEHDYRVYLVVKTGGLVTVSCRSLILNDRLRVDARAADSIR